MFAGQEIASNSLDNICVEFMRRKATIGFAVALSYNQFISLLDYDLPGALLIQVNDDDSSKWMTHFLRKCGHELETDLRLTSIVVLYSATCWIVPPCSNCVAKAILLLNSLCQCQECRSLTMQWRRNRFIGTKLRCQRTKPKKHRHAKQFRQAKTKTCS